MVFHHDRAGHLIAETGNGGLLISREYVWLEDIPLSVDASVYRAEVVTDNTDSDFFTTGAWTSSTAAPGNYGADYQAHAPAGEPSGTQIVDDADLAAGASYTGVWVPVSGAPPGYHGIEYHRSGFSLSPGAFTWSVSLVTPGAYRVYVRWVSDPGYAPDATYTVTHATGTATHTIDQTSGGGSWRLLGTYEFTTTAAVSLSDQASGTVIADAVRLIPVTALSDAATWNPPEAQTYEVYARWPASASHAPRAVYTVTHSTGSTDLIQSQQISGNQWNLLGTYTFSSTSQGVTLRADPEAAVAADAIKFIPSGASVTQRTTAFIHTDHLNTPRRMTDASQAIVWDAAYEPFGKASITAQPYFENPLTFPGQYEDAETGLHYNHHRYMDPGLGRYLQSDPIGLDGGLSTYGYAGQNPLRFTDPDGLDYWIENAAETEMACPQQGCGSHQSFCVGQPGGQRFCISFGRMRGQGWCFSNCKGHVYPDNSKAGPIAPDSYRKSSAETDAKIVEKILPLLGTQARYDMFGSPGQNCRTFSQDLFSRMDKEFMGTRAPAPEVTK